MDSAALTHPSVYLLDTSSLFFRAYYAIPALSNTKGMPTNALYGFLSMILKFQNQWKPRYLACCLDSQAPSFRVGIDPAYKSNRRETPPDLKVQIPYIKKLARALGLQVFEQSTYEADDLIGTLTKRGVGEGLKVIIVSGDKDFAQLVKQGVSLYDPMKGVMYNSEGVKGKWGINPGQMIDFLSLTGDNSDNIPGVRGIGPKGAVKLLHQYKNLENIYKHLQEIPPTTANKLRNAKKEAFLSQKLVRIVQDMGEIHQWYEKKGSPPAGPVMDLKKIILSPKKPTVEELFRSQPPNPHKLKPLLEELNFKNFEKKIFKTKEGQPPSSKKGGGAPSASAPSVSSASLSGPPRLVGNLRTHSLGWSGLCDFIDTYRPVWLFEGPEEGKWFLSHKNRVIDLKDHSLHQVGLMLSEKRTRWCGHDLKKIFKTFQCSHPLPGWCSLVAYYTLHSSHESFKRLRQKYLPPPSPDVLEPGLLFQAHQKIKTLLEGELKAQGLEDFYKTGELPLTAVLFEMEQKGVVLNPRELARQAGVINNQLQRIEKDVFSLTQKKFNLSSPKQLAEVLFQDLGLKPLRKTKTGYSTDMDVLVHLKNRHPLIPLALKHRELFKLKTTYVEVLPRLINPGTGRLHTHFHQTGTVTGRLSSSRPNLQNIPIRTEQGRKIRKAFTAPEGYCLISADYSQTELRMLAHLSEDPVLLQAFEQDLDIHQATASQVYSLPLREVSLEHRRRAKAINFGLIYGQGPYTLSKSLGVSLNQGKEIIESYFKKFKRVRDYMESVVSGALRQGYVRTLSGRKRFLPELSHSRVQTRRQGERMAINTPVQSAASELMKKVMIQLRNSVQSPQLLQIHDEILFECPQARVQGESQRIRRIMEEGFDGLRVPLKVHIAHGKDWLSCHPL